MVPGQNKPQTLNIINVKNDGYHAFSLLPVSKSHESLSVYRRHVRQILKGSIIG